MKALLTLAITLLTSYSISALTPSRDLAQVTRVLVNNPTIVNQLKKNNSDHLSDYKITALKPGVYQYDLVFTRQCECIPSTALVTIIEDMTPTYADGPIAYKATILIK